MACLCGRMLRGENEVILSLRIEGLGAERAGMEVAMAWG